MSVTSAIPEVGQIVRVRQRLYLVEGLVARPRPQDSTLVELSCIEDDAQGQELDVLWERELDAAVLTGEEWARIAQRGFACSHNSCPRPRRPVRLRRCVRGRRR